MTKKYYFTNSPMVFVLLAAVIFAALIQRAHADVPVVATHCSSLADAGNGYYCGLGVYWQAGLNCIEYGVEVPAEYPDPTILGTVLQGQSIRILGGQRCAMGSGAEIVDMGGYYTTNLGGNSPSHLFPPDVSVAPVWTYTKNQGTWYPPADQIPAGEFVDPNDPVYNDRLFPGGVARFSIPRTVDDGYYISVGAQTYNNLTPTCLSGYPGNPSAPHCYGVVPGSVGGFSPLNPGVPANPGDTIGFAVLNISVANGPGPWGAGEADFQVGPGYSCINTAYENFANNGANPAPFKDVVDYHPTAMNQCDPAVPAIDGTFEDSGQDSITINIPQGQSQTLNFDYNDTGDANSKAINILCSTTGVDPKISVTSLNCSNTSVTNTPGQ